MSYQSFRENVRNAVQEMKNGNSPDLNLNFGDYEEHIKALSKALEEKGKDQLKEKLTELTNNDPGFGKVLKAEDSWNLLNLSDMEDYETEIDFLVEDLFAETSLNLIVGDPGSLKSTFSIGLGMRVATGHEFLSPSNFSSSNAGTGFETEQGKVLLLDLENRIDLTINRIKAAEKITPPHEDEFQLAHKPSPGLRLPDKGVDDLIRHINRENFDMVIVDNLKDSSIGIDENHSDMASVMSQYERVVDECEVALFLIHHTKKSQSSRREGNNIRGSSVIEGAADTVTLIEREDDDFIDLKLIKNRFGEEKEFGAEWSKKVSSGDSNSLEEYIFFKSESSSDRSKKERRAERGILKTLQNTPKLNQSEVIEKVKEIEEVGKDTIRNTLDYLEEEGDIKVDEGKKNNASLYRVSEEYVEQKDFDFDSES